MHRRLDYSCFDAVIPAWSEINDRYHVFLNPLGWAGVAVSERGVCRVVLPKRSGLRVKRELRHPGSVGRDRGRTKKPSTPLLKKTAALLRRYFDGTSVSFNLSVDLRFSTDFQRSVWDAVKSIPYGETRSYAWIAQRIGKPRAARAVGQALGANPLPIIIP